MDADEVRERWAERSGEFSPEYYAHRGADETSDLIRRWLERTVGRDGAVLEIGCSSGRHLAHLHDHGFTDLAGIEVNADAVDVMARTYPDIADAATVRRTAVEDVIETVPEGRYDAVISVETLQHIHPDDEWVFDEIARITDDVLITAENEGEAADELSGGSRDVTVGDHIPLYYRYWRRVFDERGLEFAETIDRGRLTIRVFRS